jgi:hypothetical protein
MEVARLRMFMLNISGVYTQATHAQVSANIIT